jgi:hypothetical protein
VEPAGSVEGSGRGGRFATARTVATLGVNALAGGSQQNHPTTNFLCSHTSTIYDSNVAHQEFFLQSPDETVHYGTAQSGWRA